MTFASPKICVRWIRNIRRSHRFPLAFDLRTYRFGIYRDYYWALYILTEIPSWLSTLNLGYLYQRRIIDQNNSFRHFWILKSTWRDSICENTFETSHDRFIHENFSVLITTPLDQIRQNLLRKQTCHGQTCGHRFEDVIWRIPNPTSNYYNVHHETTPLPVYFSGVPSSFFLVY